MRNRAPGSGIHSQVEYFQGQFVAFFIYIMAAYAETNRIPFDLAGSGDRVGRGYHTEYSSMKFAMFFMAEYANMFTVACLASIMFLGGWSGPCSARRSCRRFCRSFWFAVRVFAFIFVYIWVRGTLPRFRYDQLMAFGWKFLLPLAIANIVVTAPQWRC
jgi:NADH-quinone oxidoreductase subunit H